MLGESSATGRPRRPPTRRRVRRLWTVLAALSQLSPAGGDRRLQNAQELAEQAAAAAFYWSELALDITRSSTLTTGPGMTLETDTLALIAFFNKTAAASAAMEWDVMNPYRGAFADEGSKWRHQDGWKSILSAHSNVRVQCQALYMAGGEEFTAKFCFWKVGSLQSTNATTGVTTRETRFPIPEWTIVRECCEPVARPVLRLHDAVWATTNGVGRFFRTSAHEADSSKDPWNELQARRAASPTTAHHLLLHHHHLRLTPPPPLPPQADDYEYVPQFDCTKKEIIDGKEVYSVQSGCDPSDNELYKEWNDDAPTFQQKLVPCPRLADQDEGETNEPGVGDECTAQNRCCRVSRPAGLRSKRYFNVGIAVGEDGTLVRTMDGGYTWEDLRDGGQKGALGENDLLSVSVNVRLGGVGYEATYMGPMGESPPFFFNDIKWTQLELDKEDKGFEIGKGLDGVYWEADWLMEGYAVGEFGTIVKLENAGVNWSPEDGEEDPKLLRVLSPDEKRNADGSTCHTQRHIRDVYFWNRHLAFFVGDFGYICRYGLLLNEDKLNSGPGQTVDQAINGDVDVYWQLQGADELGLNWGYIIDNKDYMLSHLNSIFCFKTSGVNNEQWQALGGDTKFMTPDAPISYSSHITCMAVGTQPGKREGNPKEGTTSAILKYTSRAVNEAAVDSEVPSYREEVEWKPQNSMTTAPLNVSLPAAAPSFPAHRPQTHEASPRASPAAPPRTSTASSRRRRTSGRTTPTSTATPSATAA